jgi:hypothetical protein
MYSNQSDTSGSDIPKNWAHLGGLLAGGAIAFAVGPNLMVGPLYKLNPLDPQLEAAWFQPLKPTK